MPPKRIASDRGEQLRHRLNNNMRHVSDLRGAMGCYFCWLGEYDKCKENCKKIHVTSADKAYLKAGVAPPDPVRDNTWDRATPFFTSANKQQQSMYSEMERDYFAQQVKTVTTPGEFITGVAVPYSHGPERSLAQQIGHYTPGPKTRREKYGIHSLHEPMQNETPYKHARGSEWVRATKHTNISVTPTSHSYSAHNKRLVPRDGSAIWSGQLVKSKAVANDDRSQQLAARRRSRSAGVGGRSASRSGAALSASASSPYLRVREEEQMSRIASGQYMDAFQMPLPGVFNLA